MRAKRKTFWGVVLGGIYSNYETLIGKRCSFNIYCNRPVAYPKCAVFSNVIWKSNFLRCIRQLNDGLRQPKHVAHIFKLSCGENYLGAAHVKKRQNVIFRLIQGSGLFNK